MRMRDPCGRDNHWPKRAVGPAAFDEGPSTRRRKASAWLRDPMGVPCVPPPVEGAVHGDRPVWAGPQVEVLAPTDLACPAILNAGLQHDVCALLAFQLDLYPTLGVLNCHASKL